MSLNLKEFLSSVELQNMVAIDKNTMAVNGYRQLFDFWLDDGFGDAREYAFVIETI